MNTPIDIGGISVELNWTKIGNSHRYISSVNQKENGISTK
jgi:hypothetical protein